MTSRSILLVIMSIIFWLLSLSGDEIVGKYAFMICAVVTSSAATIINAIREEFKNKK